MGRKAVRGNDKPQKARGNGERLRRVIVEVLEQFNTANIGSMASKEMIAKRVVKEYIGDDNG